MTTLPINRDHPSHCSSNGGEDFVSTQPTFAANDNGQDWLTSIGHPYETVASLEEPMSRSWKRGVVVFVAAAVSVMVVGWGYVVAVSFAGIERMLLH
jgi:hypothetical protein